LDMAAGSDARAAPEKCTGIHTTVAEIVFIPD